MKISVKAELSQGFKAEAQVRAHRIVADLTPDKGGGDAGPTPPELLLASLAACSAIYAKMFAQREGLSGSILVEAEAEMPDPPTHLEKFQVRVTIPGLSPDQREKAKAFVEQCLVGRTLRLAQEVECIIQG